MKEKERQQLGRRNILLATATSSTLVAISIWLNKQQGDKVQLIATEKSIPWGSSSRVVIENTIFNQEHPFSTDFNNLDNQSFPFTLDLVPEWIQAFRVESNKIVPQNISLEVKAMKPPTKSFRALEDEYRGIGTSFDMLMAYGPFEEASKKALTNDELGRFLASVAPKTLVSWMLIELYQMSDHTSPQGNSFGLAESTRFQRMFRVSQVPKFNYWQYFEGFRQQYPET